MEDVFDAAWLDQHAASSNQVEAELASLIDIYGLALLDESAQLRRQLMQACPDSQRPVAAIVAAMSAGIPKRLRAAQIDGKLPALLQQSAQYLSEQTMLDADSASWAVRAWAHALALPTEGLVEATLPAPSAAAPNFATTPPPVRPDHAPPSRDQHIVRRPGDHDGSARVSGIEGTSTIARMWDAPMSRPPNDRPSRTEPTTSGSTPDAAAPLPSKPLDEIEAPAQVESAAGPAADRWLPDSDPADASSFTTSGIGSSLRNEPSLRSDGETDAGPHPTDHPEPEHPPILVEPLFSEHDLQRLARNAPDRGIVGTTPEQTATFGMPRDADPVTGGNPTDAANGAIPPFVPPPWERAEPHRSRSFVRPVLIGLVLAAVAFAAWYELDGQRFFADRTTASRPAPDATTTARTESVPEAPAGNAAAVSPPAPMPSGDAVAPPEVPPATDAPAKSAASNDTVVATPPVAEPPAVERPAVEPRQVGNGPAIARVDVPRVVEGAPFTVSLRLSGKARDVASVERRIVADGGSWPRSGPVALGAGLQRSGDGTLLIPFKAMDAPARATVEFTAIGRDGSRGATKSVAIVVAATAPAVATAAVAATCTASTCGTVVEARELLADDAGRGSVYQIVVRMDDRQTRAFSAPYRLQNGSRVRLQGDRFVPAGANLP